MKDFDYLLEREGTNRERDFVGMRKVLSGKVMESMNTMYEETERIVHAHIDGWRNRLKNLGNLITTLVVAPSSLPGAALGARPNIKPRALGE